MCFSGNFVQLKEIQFRPNIEAHDLQVKLKKIEQFIGESDKVKMVMTQANSLSVDTEEDRRNVEQLMEGDQLMSAYLNASR